jgi:hypothetical protein
MTRPNPFSRKPKTGYREAIDRIKQVARTTLRLPEAVGVSVSELACRETGCPDIETVVAIFLAGERPRVFRFHKAIIEIDDADLLASFTADEQPRR